MFPLGQATVSLRIALVVTLCCAAEIAYAQAKFTPLGDLPGPIFLSTAYDVSSDGTIVVGAGSSATSLFSPAAFRWTANGGMVDLDNLGSDSSAAFGVSGDGSVVVGQSHSPNGREAFRWTAGNGMVGLGDFPGGSFDSAATRASADGAVVVGYGASATGIFQAFRWTAAGGMAPITNLLGGAIPSDAFISRSPAISADGSTVVGFTVSPNRQEAARWTSAGGVVGLGDLPGGVFVSEAADVSRDGSTIVGFGTSAGGREAFRWTAAEGLIGLGDLVGGPFASYAYGVSDDGAVVVGASRPSTGIEAFYWTRSTGMVSLRDLLITRGANNLAGWTLVYAYDVSPDGLTIVGAGINPAGSQEAWVATIPEPSTFLLAALTIAVSAGICFRLAAAAPAAPTQL